MEKLTVLTLNTWNREAEYAKRESLIRSWIEVLNPDLIGFQEVEREQANDILHEMDYEFEWDGHGESGMCIGAKWPINEFTKHDLPGIEPGSIGGIVLTCRVSTPVGTIPFANATTYFPMMHDGWKREQQMPQLLECVKSIRVKQGFPVVLVGDFNAEPESGEIRFLKGLQSIAGTSAYFGDAWERGGDGTMGETWTRRNRYSGALGLPDRRIDYVFIGSPAVLGPGRVRDCRVVCDVSVDDIWPSDHFGVFAELATS